MLFQNKLMLELSLWALQSKTSSKGDKRQRSEVKLKRMNTTIAVWRDTTVLQ